MSSHWHTTAPTFSPHPLSLDHFVNVHYIYSAIYYSSEAKFSSRTEQKKKEEAKIYVPPPPHVETMKFSVHVEYNPHIN